MHLLNNKTKVPYSDEFNVGVRKRFGKINTAITFSYIRSHNIYQEVVGNRFRTEPTAAAQPRSSSTTAIPYRGRNILRRRRDKSCASARSWKHLHRQQRR